MGKRERNMKYFLIIIPLFFVVACNLNMLSPSISVAVEDYTVGRLSYISVRVTQGAFPVSNKMIKFQKLTGSYWEDLKDDISNQSVITTNSEGVASLRVVFKNPGTYTIRAILLPENISKVFSIYVKPVKWIFLLWFAADNDLYQCASGDLEEMEGITGDFSLRIIFDTPSDTQLGYLDNQGNIVLTNIEEINSGDGDTLKSELMKILSVPSDYYGLIIWNHGIAWIYDSLYEKIVSIDNSSGDALTTKEMKEAIEGALEESNLEKLNILGLDACLMGSLEVLYELKDTAYYIIASASTEPGEGWNYRFLGELSSDVLDVCRKIVDYYFDDLPNEEEITLAVFDTSAFNQFIENFNAFSLRILYLFEEDLDFKQRFESYQENLKIYPILGGTERVLVDFGEFLEILKNEKELRDYISQIPIEELIVYSKVSEDLKNLSGMSIFFPSREYYDYFINDYYSLSFIDATYWDYVLANLYGE